MKADRSSSSSVSWPMLFLFAAFLPLFSSCSSLLNSYLVEPAIVNLQKQTDYRLVCEGGAAYLLMVDSLIASDPDDPALLLMGAKTYSAYVTVLAECGAQPQRLRTKTTKARRYGTTLLAQLVPIGPGDSLENLDRALRTMTKDEVEPLFWGATAWTTWVARQRGSPDSLADLVKIEAIMLRLLELDEGFENGSIHLVLGSYYGARPKMIGGRPEQARTHFERGLELSNRSYLPLQTAYAEHYCRMTLNRELHDKLLHEVVDFPLQKAPGQALANQVAKVRARKLLEENFFDE